MHHLDRELDALKQELFAMAAKAKGAVEKAVRALVERNDDLAEQVQWEDDTLDQFEIDVDERAILLLSKAPMATQLRLITVAMKVSQNLERIGDEATTIARRSLKLGREPELKAGIDLPHLAQTAVAMIDDALEAFVNGDVTTATNAITRDKQVDAINRRFQQQLFSHMVESPNSISRCLDLMVVSKSLERIADHAANIAEEVVYLFEARDVRHAGVKVASLRNPPGGGP